MKKISIYLLIVLLLVGLIPQVVYSASDDYPEGVIKDKPTTTKPYYIHMVKTTEEMSNPGELETYYRDYWILSDYESIEVYILDTSVEYGYYFSQIQRDDLYNNGNINYATKLPLFDLKSSAYYDNTFGFTLEDGLSALDNGGKFIVYHEERLYKSGGFVRYPVSTTYEILESNMTIIDETTGEELVGTSGTDNEDLIIPDTLGYVEIKYGDLNVLHDTLDIRIDYRYKPNQYYYTNRDWIFEVDTDNGVATVTGHKTITSLFTGMGYVEGYYTYRIKPIPIGTTEVNAYLYTDDGELMYSDTALYNRIEFTDIDGDGIDDTTGWTMPEDESIPDIIEDNIYDMPNRMSYDQGILGTISYSLDLVMYYITLPFKWIGQGLNELSSWLSSSMDWITNISNFFNSIFGFLPDEFRSLIYVMVLITVVFSVFKLMRS